LICNSKDNLAKDGKKTAGQRVHANDVVAVMAMFIEETSTAVQQHVLTHSDVSEIH